MRWFVTALLLLGLAGVSLLVYASTLPVYTDPEAPGRLSGELDSLPREVRYKEWYARLRTYETPHKNLSDWGRGLVTAVAGIATAGVWLAFYQRQNWMRQGWLIFGVWLALWALRVPLSMWYYGVRHKRFDFPIWGDSIAIPVMQETFAWIFGAVISSLVLGVLLIRHPLPTRIHLVRPCSMFGWFRATFLTLWFFLLLCCAISGIFDGDEGMAFSCSVAGAVLLIFLSASERQPLTEHAPESACKPTE